MKVPRAFVMLHLVVLGLTMAHSSKTFRAMQLSQTKQVMQMQGGNELCKLKRKHSDENEYYLVQFDEKRKKAEESGDQGELNKIMMEHSSKQQAMNSRQSAEEQQMMQKYKNKEVPLDMEIEMTNTQVQVLKADLDSYQKTLDNALKGSGMDS